MIVLNYYNTGERMFCTKHNFESVLSVSEELWTAVLELS